MGYKGVRGNTSLGSIFFLRPEEEIFFTGLSRDPLSCLSEFAIGECMSGLSPVPQITASFDSSRNQLHAEALHFAHETYVTRGGVLLTGILSNRRWGVSMTASNDAMMLTAILTLSPQTGGFASMHPTHIDELRRVARLPPLSQTVPQSVSVDVSAVAPVVLEIRELLAKGMITLRLDGRFRKALSAIHKALKLARHHLPADSLVTANVTRHALTMNLAPHECNDQAVDPQRSYAVALQDDDASPPGRLPFEMHICFQRWINGTLYELRPDESLFLGLGPCFAPASHGLPVPNFVDLMSYAAGDINHWPASAISMDQRVAYVQATMLALLEARRRGNAATSVGPGHDPRFAGLVVGLDPEALPCRSSLVGMLLTSEPPAPGERPSTVFLIRSGVVLTFPQLKELLLLGSYSGAAAIQSDLDRDKQRTSILTAARQAARTVDAARGLCVCTRPGCDERESFALHFKRCTGLGNACKLPYCSAACHTADWKRHKQEDGCSNRAS
jgi:hypothetical protein